MTIKDDSTVSSCSTISSLASDLNDFNITQNNELCPEALTDSETETDSITETSKSVDEVSSDLIERPDVSGFETIEPVAEVSPEIIERPDVGGSETIEPVAEVSSDLIERPDVGGSETIEPVAEVSPRIIERPDVGGSETIEPIAEVSPEIIERSDGLNPVTIERPSVICEMSEKTGFTTPPNTNTPDTCDTPKRVFIDDTNMEIKENKKPLPKTPYRRRGTKDINTPLRRSERIKSKYGNQNREQNLNDSLQS